MTSSLTILLLLTAIGSVLAFATIVARVLRYRAAASGRNETVENLAARIDSWWIIVVLIAIALALGERGVILLFAGASFFALREYQSLTPLAQRHSGMSMPILLLAVPLQYLLIARHAYGLYSIFIPVCAFVVLPIVAALSGRTRGFLGRVAEAQWGLMVTVYCVSHAAALTTLELRGFEGRALLLVVFLIIVTQVSDVLQYVTGKLFGRRPIAPMLSPNKTIEGTVCGILGATLIGAALSFLTPFTPVTAGWLSLLVTSMAFLGGLVMSAIKRDRGVKDWGATIPGHGGVLDRIDSLVFAAPVFFHVTRFGWAG